MSVTTLQVMPRMAGLQGSIVHNLILHFYKRLFPQLDHVTWQQLYKLHQEWLDYKGLLYTTLSCISAINCFHGSIMSHDNNFANYTRMAGQQESIVHNRILDYRGCFRSLIVSHDSNFTSYAKASFQWQLHMSKKHQIHILHTAWEHFLAHYCKVQTVVEGPQLLA